MARLSRSEGMRRENRPMKKTALSRRKFLQISSASSLGLLLSNLPHRWIGGGFAADAPGTAKIRFGIISPTHCSSVGMGHEFCLFKKNGIESTNSQETSLAASCAKL